MCKILKRNFKKKSLMVYNYRASLVRNYMTHICAEIVKLMKILHTDR